LGIGRNAAKHSSPANLEQRRPLMSRVKYAVLPAIALVVVVAVTASASPSVPEWFKGGSPIGETTSISFTGKSIAGTPTLQSTVGNIVKCENSTSKGEISGPRAIKNTKVTYHGCVEGTAKCASTGQLEGTVVTNTLVGENVYLDAAHQKAGVVLKAASGTKFATFKCGSTEVQVTGNLIAEASPLNEGDKTTGHLIFVQEEGHQLWQKVEEAGESRHIVAFLVEAGVGGGTKATSPLNEEDTFSSAVELHRS
jgi:hypothetical protein